MAETKVEKETKPQKESFSLVRYAKHGLTLRAVLIGFLLMPINAYWIIQMELVKYSGHPTTFSLFFNCIFTLLVLVGINALLHKYVPKWAFKQQELITIYLILEVASAITGHDRAEVLVSVITYPFYYATPENKWDSLFLYMIPSWLSVTDPVVLKDFFMGQSSLWTARHLTVFAKPILMWLSFFLGLYVTYSGMNIIIRKQWMEREKLTFPLVALPLEMTAPGYKFYKNKLMWLAFAIPCFINLVDNLHMVYPAVPLIHTMHYELNQYITTFPWTAVGWLPVSFYPWAIGLGFLLPLDLLFSCWFFFLFFKAESITAAALSLGQNNPQAPYIPEQAFGGYIGIALFALWAMRHHLAAVWDKVLGRKTWLDDTGEALGYRWAALLTVGGFIFLVWFSMQAGMTAKSAVAFFVIFLLVSITVDRLRAELGAPVHDLHDADPGQMMVRVLGTNRFLPEDLTVFSLYFSFNRAYRSHSMPVQLEGMRIAERTHTKQRSALVLMTVAFAAGLVVAFWALLQVYFNMGASSGKMVMQVPLIFGREPWQRLQSWMENGVKPEPGAGFAIIAGLLFTLGLMFLRLRLVGMPFHPMGYAISSSWGMHMVWTPLFIAWLCKKIIIRYGGLKLYRQVVPFFLGLILGDFTSGAIANIIGVIYNLPVYHFLG